MSPSYRILDENLSQLIRRAYQPALPRPEFVGQLESKLAPWIGAEEPVDSALRLVDSKRGESTPLESGRSPARGWAIGLVAAAAALFLMLRLFDDPDFSNSEPDQYGTLEWILELGNVAARDGEDAPWRMVYQDEAATGVVHEGPYTALATPRETRIQLRGEGGWAVELAASSHLLVEDLEGRTRVTLSAGRMSAAKGLRVVEFPHVHDWLEAPYVLDWIDGAWFEASGIPWKALVTRNPEDLISARESVPQEDGTDEPEESTLLDPSLARLTGEVAIAGESEALGAFTVTLLREVPLPQVSFPRLKEFVDAGGVFEWEGLTPGTYSAFVGAPGRAIWKSEKFELLAGQTHALEVRLAMGAVIRGFVIDRASGAAVANALVLSESDMPTRIVSLDEAEFPASARAFTRTRNDGFFELPDMGLGSHRLRASSDEYAPQWIEVELGESNLDGVQFELTPGGSVEGRCEHADGRPFVNGRVIASRFSTSSPGSAMTYMGVETDESGNYRIDHLAPGMYVVLYYSENAQNENFQPRYSPVAISEGTVQRVDFLGEQRGASITGLVTYGDGSPVPFANLHAWSYQDGSPHWYGETADETGRFELIGIEPGEYGLYAGPANCTVLVATVDVKVGTRVEQDVVLQGLSVDVKVFDAETREAIAYMDLSLVKSAQGELDAEQNEMIAARVFTENGGGLRLEFLEPGLYDILAVPEAGEFAIGVHNNLWVAEDGGDREVEILLEKACRAKLVLVDPEGQAIEGVKVELVSPANDRWSHPWTPISDGEGVLELERLSPGRWQVSLSHEDFLEQSFELNMQLDNPIERRVQLQSR